MNIYLSIKKVQYIFRQQKYLFLLSLFLFYIKIFFSVNIYKYLFIQRQRQICKICVQNNNYWNKAPLFVIFTKYRDANKQKSLHTKEKSLFHAVFIEISCSFTLKLCRNVYCKWFLLHIGRIPNCPNVCYKYLRSAECKFSILISCFFNNTYKRVLCLSAYIVYLGISLIPDHWLVFVLSCLLLVRAV